MTSHYTRVKSLFQAALDRTDAAERMAFLDAQCGDDEALRAELDELFEFHSSDGTVFERELVGGARTLPESIGPYRIVRRIGEGGMGTVFEAEQDNPRRLVALKLLRGALASESLLRRFELEGHLLGRLHHAGIAQIYDAGTTDGHTREPWIVMELVDGAPLTRYASEQRLGPRGCIELILKVAEAVEHAHQRGVIHRDLKPDNILVEASGQPKVLDFGIARAVDDGQGAEARTRTGQLMGTLAYMSPEQAAGDSALLDTRTDVYALGAMLYELLAGRVPIEVTDLPLRAALLAIAENEPPSLGALDRDLRGDVEIIVARALAKEPDRRYPSVTAFAEDLQRYLSDEPIVARPATTMYQIKKFTRRHRALVTAIAAVAAALLVGIVVSTRLYWIAEGRRIDAARAGERERAQRVVAEAQRSEAESQSLRADAQRAIAQRRASQAEAVTDFLTGALTQADPMENVEAQDLSVRTMLDRAARGVATAFRDQPATEAAVRLTIASAYHGLGELSSALEHAERALELQRTLTTGATDDVSLTLILIGLVQSARAEYGAAQEALDEALARLREAHPDEPGHPSILAALQASSVATLGAGDLARTRETLKTSLDLLDRRGDGDPLVRAEIHNNLAAVDERYHDIPSALAHLEEALPLMRDAYGELHPTVATALNNVAVASFQLGDRERAEECMREALAIRRKAYGEDHPAVAETLANLAILLGNTPAAVELLTEALAIDRRRLGADHPTVATILNNLGLLLKGLGRHAEAHEHYLESLDIRRRALGPEHPDIANSLQNIGVLLESRGEHEAALPFVEECLEMRAHVLPPGHPDTGVAERFLDSLHSHLERE